jgi:hypothetical protein
MQLAYRSTRRYQPDKKDTLVSSREQAFKLIEDLDRKLAAKLSSQQKATYLCARAVLYEALGHKYMLEAAQAAFAYSKTSQSAALVAVALHHYGRIREAITWYKRTAAYPHEQGFEVDIGHQGALLFEQTAESWLAAWHITLSLKKRITYAAHLPTWDGQPVKELQVLSEGGFGDLIQNCRYLPLLAAKGVEKVTVYVPPYFYENGFVDLARRQDWWPETKLLTECKMNVPSAGFFDLPAIFKTTPDTIPPEPVWLPPVNAHCGYTNGPENKPRVGFCFAARAMETPIVAEDIYRTLSRTTAESIVQNTDGVRWFSLQKNESLPGVYDTNLTSWEDTAELISNLDLVISVDTAVAHLAASMNKPTWLLLSGAVDWKWGIEGTTSRWYKNIRIFRNDAWGFDRSVAALIQAINDGELCQSSVSPKPISAAT